MTSMFDRLTWDEDRMFLDDLVFELERPSSDQPTPAQDRFHFYKTRHLVEQYARYWRANAGFDARRTLELGIWDGGSVAFWFEYFRPNKHVAIDIARKTDSPYFESYRTSRGLEGAIRTYWGVDQADSIALRQLISAEFSDELDLVIDDASHIYEPTKVSFEVVFPFLRPGGLYIIEDWGWEHWRACYLPTSAFAAERGLTHLLHELIGATASSTELVTSMTVLQGFVAVERGELRFPPGSVFQLKDFISQRPSRARAAGLVRKGLRRGTGRARSMLRRIVREPKRMWERRPR
jgi:hypothetical protein